MISYNTSFVLSPSDAEALLKFLRQDYIPTILAGGRLHNPSLRQVEQAKEDAEATAVYALSFEVKSREELDKYLDEEGQIAYEQIARTFGDRVLTIPTIMHHVELSLS